VAQTCNPQQLRRQRSGRLKFEVNSSKKLVRCHTCLSSQLCRKHKIRGTVSRPAQTKTWDPIPKITKAERTGDMA
jgi:hypothetical protein